jgi:hypothetical protein
MSCWLWGILLAFATVSGTVEDSEGRPVPDARVVWNCLDGVPHILIDPVVQTDKSGRFHLKLFRFQAGVFEVTAPGYGFTRTDFLDLSWNWKNDLIKIVVPDALRVQGLVLGPDGMPVAGARIVTPDHFRYGITSRETERSVAFTASDGTFRADTLQRGQETLLEARANGFSPGEVTANPKPTEDQIDVVIRLKEERILEGKVVDAADKPVQARLWAFGTQESTQTDAAGAFKLALMPHGELSIFIIPEGFAPREITVESGATNLIIRLTNEADGK